MAAGQACKHTCGISTVPTIVTSTPLTRQSPLRSIIVGKSVRSGSDFWRRVECAAGGFDAMGAGSGSCVGILLRNDFAFLEATRAAQRVGAYAVPLNWHSTPDEIEYILRDCQPSVVVAHADLLTPAVREALRHTAIIVVYPPIGMVAAYGGTTREISDLPDWEGWLESSPAFLSTPRPMPPSLIYTSGTGGRPKGVKRAAPNALQLDYSNRMRQMLTQMEENARVLIPAPLYHTAPNMFALRAASHSQLLVLPWRFNPEELLEDIERHGITHLYAVPTMFHRLLALDEQTRRRFDLSSLRFVLHAGGPCPVEVKRAMMNWLGPIIYEYYGSTDAGPLTFSTPAMWLANPGTVGQAIAGVDLAILDDQGNRLPAGSEGEIGGKVNGYPDFEYIGLPEARKAVNRGALIATGDMGRLDEKGNLFLTDRKIDMIVSGGVNIYPAEIEAALLSIEEIADCAVFGIPDAEFSEAVAAVVQCRPGAEISGDELRARLRDRLASFKLPRHIEFRESLPREETGKIRKRTLREPYWADSGRKI